MNFTVNARTLLLLLALAACNAPTTAPTLSPSPTATTTRPVSTASASPSPAPTAIVPTAALARSTSARLNDPFTLKGSEWVTLLDANDSRVFFTNVLEDSRCPANVNCFQAGGVRVLISLETGGRLAHFDLSTKPADRRAIGGYNGLLVELIDIAPLPRGIGTPFPLSDYQVTLRVRAGSLGSAPPRIGEPFTLKPGQSADLGDIRLSFESVKQDSRCPARALCATSGTVTLATLFQVGGSSERYLLAADARAVLQQTMDGYLVLLNGLSPYPQNEFASKEIAPSDYEATFVVFGKSGALVTPAAGPTATPTFLAGCPNLSSGEASEILGEAVKSATIEMILFPPSSPSITLHGLCGYGSVLFTPNKAASKGLPGVYPAMVQSDHAVIAAQLTDVRRLEQLLSIASAIDTASPNGSNLYNKLQTSYAAGAWSRDMLADFPDAARGATNLTVTRVAGLGDNAIWVWQEFDGGRYAALVAQKGETLFVVITLTSAQRTEDGLLSALTALMHKML